MSMHDIKSPGIQACGHLSLRTFAVLQQCEILLTNVISALRLAAEVEGTQESYGTAGVGQSRLCVIRLDASNVND
jgi:hypothetical protein